MKGTVRSNNQQSRKQVTPERIVTGREANATGGNDSSKSPSRFGNTVAPTKPRSNAEGVVRPTVTSSLPFPLRKAPKTGNTVSPNLDRKRVSAIVNVGSPARSQTPKLERRYSFEEVDDGTMVTSLPTHRPSGVPNAREKPVKPARKNVPKVGTPRGSPPAPGGGINAIFSSPGVSPGAIRRRPSPSNGGRSSEEGGSAVRARRTALLPNQGVKNGGKRGNAARATGDVVRDVGVDAGLALGSFSGATPDGSAVSSESSVGGAAGGSGTNEESDSSAASPDSVKSQEVLQSGGVSRVAKLGTGSDPGSCEDRNETGRDSGSRTNRPFPIDRDDEETRILPSAPEDARKDPNLNYRNVSNGIDLISRNLEGESEYWSLVSQDSGVSSFSQSIDSSRNMLLEVDDSSTRSDDARCCHISSERFHGEFGDVSEDIGLERLATLCCGKGFEGREPGYGLEEPLIFHINNGGRFKLFGEFGDVSDDLGAGRFPSLEDQRTRGTSVGPSVGHSHPCEDGGLLVHRRCCQVDVQDFAGVSADSGIEEVEDVEEEEDMYEYDEDFAGAGSSLDEELILEVLCANRVNQMTRTYNDIEAVSRLLEEKEKDLELTARIGKELLDQNQGLKVRLAALEVEIRSAHDENTQLKHELQQKTQLLHALTSDEDGSPHDLSSPLVSPSCGSIPPIPAHHLAGGRTSARAGVELLKRRIAWLEDENKSLRFEASQLARDTQRVEEEEAKLVEGVTQQLASVSEESRMLSEELERVRNEGGRQREEVDSLLSKLDQSQMEIRRLRHENEELSSLVLITKENQDRLTTELADFKERYGEVMCLLTEAQENLRKVRQKELPSALAGTRYLTPPITTHHSLQGHYGDSIALEIESSLNYGLSLDSGIHMSPHDVSPKAPHYRKVFQTVRSASRSSGSPSPSPLHQRHPSIGTSSCYQGSGMSSSFAQLSSTATLSSASSSQACRMSTRASNNVQQAQQNSGYNARASPFGETPRHLYGALPSTGFHSLDSSMAPSEESDQSEMTTDSEDCLYPIISTSGVVRDGIPGSPGAKELQAALARIAKQQHTMTPPLTKGEKAIGGYEGKSREPSLDAGSLPRWSMSSLSSGPQQLPYGCRTPDSIMSTGSSRGSSRSTWRMPEKLQIVKPLEGSLTLSWWSRLATPSLSAALEERPGVKVRGGAGADGATQHTLLDLEEDDSISMASTAKEAPTPIHPGKFFQGTGSVYTYTNSTVLHPDNTVPPSPVPQSPVAASSQPTPLLSRRSSVSTATPTFSTALGLAKMLRERGISASSSTEDLQAASQAHFTSATATPCNSPDESATPTRSPSPELLDEDANPITSLISSGAELLRRSLAGSLAPIPPRAAPGSANGRRPPLSRSDRKALVGMKLVEKLEQIGLQSIMANPLHRPVVPLMSTLQVGTMYARPAVKSPMAQLTSLKSALRSRSVEGTDSGLESTMGGGQEAVVRPRRQPKRRQDLGTVPVPKKRATTTTRTDGAAHVGATRGSISAIFFGRKGGLM